MRTTTRIATIAFTLFALAVPATAANAASTTSSDDDGLSGVVDKALCVVHETVDAVGHVVDVLL